MVLTPEETEIAAWHADGREQAEIAGWLGICRQAAGKRIAAIQAKLPAAKIPPIKPLIERHDTRHNRSLGNFFREAI